MVGRRVQQPGLHLVMQTCLFISTLAGINVCSLVDSLEKLGGAQ